MRENTEPLIDRHMTAVSTIGAFFLIGGFALARLLAG